MTQSYQLSNRIFDKGQEALATHARNTQTILNQIPVTEQRIIEALYAEPLTIGQLAEEPFCLELVRVLNLTQPTKTVLCGSMVHFTWLPQQNGAVISSIDGLSPVTDGQTQFRFFFRVTYKAAA